MEERKMILKMIEEGKISAEHGLKLLEAIEKNNKKEERDFHFQSNEGSDQQEVNRRIKVELHDATEKIISAANKGASKLVDIIGKAVSKLQNIDIDIELDLFSDAVKITEFIEVKPFDARNISIFTNNGSIRCESWDKDHMEIQVIAQVHNAKDELEAREIVSNNMERKQEGNTFSIQVNDKKGIRIALELRLPKHMYETLHFNTNNGSVQLKSLQADKVKISTANGSIRVHDLKSDKVLAKTSNGRLQFNELQAEFCEYRTNNGSIQVSGHLGTLFSETTNGSIRIEQKQNNGSKLTAKTTNGSVRMVYPDGIEGVYGSLQSQNGPIRCQLDGIKTERNGGRFEKALSFQQGDEENHHVQVNTNTGSITILTKGDDTL